MDTHLLDWPDVTRYLTLDSAKITAELVNYIKAKVRCIYIQE